ncbi:MAG: hypothetical protein ABR498_10265 [Candidatus Dormibacteria bacterium]
MTARRPIRQRFGALVSQVWDRAVLLQLSSVAVDKPPLLDLSPVDPDAFWAASTVASPRRVWIEREREPIDGPDWREVELVGESEGPGNHAASRRLRATAHLRRSGPPAPLVLLVHGYAIPFTGFDRWLAWRMRRRGAQTVRMELPFHLRRSVPGENSGDHYFSIDPAHTRAVVRQSVEDVAAVVEWARHELTADVRVLGTSLGGLISLLLTALVEVDLSLAVAPLCDPPASFTERPPGAMQHYLGMVGKGDGFWGPDRATAGSALAGALAPLVVHNLTPMTPRDRIAIVRPALDLVVGAAPMDELAAAWDIESWRYPQGHITVMYADGLPRRIVDHLTSPLIDAPGSLALAG